MAFKNQYIIKQSPALLPPQNTIIFHTHIYLKMQNMVLTIRDKLHIKLYWWKKKGFSMYEKETQDIPAFL